MDDIVSCTEKELENGTEQKRGSSINSSSLSKKHSQSTGDMLEDDNERHFFTVYRQMEIRVSDFPEGSSISSLRRKFETDTQRRPSQNLRHAKELVQHHETTDIDRKVSYTRRVGEIPKLSGGARIIRDDFHKDSNEPHDVDKQSPPDPDSARRRGSPTSASSPVVFVCTDDLLPNTDASPPPEEPQPSQDFNIVNNAIEYVPKACLSDNRKPVVPQVTPPQIIPIKNDESGVTEMLRLLDKFQRSRDERRLEDSRISQTPEVAINMHSQSREHTSRHPAVDAIPMHCSTNSHAFSLGAHHSLKISQPNIVNISVGSSTQKFHSHKEDVMRSLYMNAIFFMVLITTALSRYFIEEVTNNSKSASSHLEYN
ncbi:hypothetical protein KIN20_004480 [Parelaphostrongylus tenuis]|uniref:Uncharacterized protein n=1 Tax=Parelaphostrongylus tenuis TaxID=148309 RepID=A0AAD5MK05_PARTN|nr:hypothetical protein KIN20_004480 [Parelaphostrongylus tenuis]